MEAHGGHLGMRERVTENEVREEETWACLGRGWGDSEGKTRGRWKEAKRGGERKGEEERGGEEIKGTKNMDVSFLLWPWAECN